MIGRYVLVVSFADESPQVKFGYRVGPGISVLAHNGLAWEFDIAAGPLTEQEKEDLKAEVLSLLPERSSDLVVSHWDGHNWVGRSTRDGEAECLAIEEAIGRVEEAGPNRRGWTASEWFSNFPLENLGVSSATTDTELKEIIENAEGEAENEGYQVSGIPGYLQELREDLRAAQEEERGEGADD